jgi:putative lipoic acid-binding regulatory protein
MGFFLSKGLERNTMQKPFNKTNFKEKLEAHGDFPMLYMFKFIVPNGQESEVAAIFPKNELSLKPSSGGKYISTTVQMMVQSADEVISYYEKASNIEGVISL